MKDPQKKIYIVVTQTGTLLSRILKQITGAKYNHSSISPYADLHLMYSFGRRHPYNPFWGGFVTESIRFGTFKRFSNTQAKVLEIAVTAEQYNAICSTLETMEREREKYHYNYLGLGLAAFHICHRSERGYYCSEFVREILLRYTAISAGNLPPITQPIHFLSLPCVETVFSGRLRDYAV
ncbi:MAG: hypothetical protein IJ043_02935 [Clostridia bacterium]|nr:hypothetical protein [Clostridia bacterium]